MRRLLKFMSQKPALMRSIAFLFIASVLAASCCKKETCATLSNLPVFFYGFAPEEIDTIYTTGYAIGSEFTQETREKQADTVKMIDDGGAMLQVRNSGAVGNASLPDTYEWRIYIPGVNKTILLSDYDYSSYNCNKCGLRRGTPLRTLSTVYVNSVKRSVGEIKIYK